MSHGHHHSHSSASHSHQHAPPDFGRAFAIAIFLNLTFVVVEFSYGLIADSTALMADAGHNLSDVLALLLAWGAAALSKCQASRRYTFGLRSSSILAALANSVLLFLACGAIAWESIQRLANPTEVEGVTVMAVASIGILVNGVSALLFAKGSHHDLNVRAAFLHLLADALISLGVVIAGGLVLQTGWVWIDPVTSLIIVAVIVVGTSSLFRDAVRISMNAVPTNVDLDAIEQYLVSMPGVSGIGDLHVWAVSTTENLLTVRLIMPLGSPGDDFLETLSATLSRSFQIAHSTIQIQKHDIGHGCELH